MLQLAKRPPVLLVLDAAAPAVPVVPALVPVAPVALVVPETPVVPDAAAVVLEAPEPLVATPVLAAVALPLVAPYVLPLVTAPEAEVVELAWSEQAAKRHEMVSQPKRKPRMRISTLFTDTLRSRYRARRSTICASVRTAKPVAPLGR
jgi:hypothetical protein